MKSLSFRQLLKNKFSNLSISSKFSVSLLLLLFLPLLLLFLWINQNVTTQIREQSCKTNLEILKQTKTSIQYMISDVSYISLQVLGNSDLQDYFSSIDHLDQKEYDKYTKDIQYQINNLMESRNYISRLSVFDEEQIYFQFGAYLAEENLMGMKEARELQGKATWLAAHLEEQYLSKKDRIYEVSFIRAINDITRLNHIVAFERISIPENYLCSLYRGIEGNGTENIFVIDGKGKVLSSIDKELLGKDRADDYLIKQLQGKREGYYVSQNQLISFYSIPDPGWYIVKIDHADAIMRGQLFNSIILICIALTIVFGVCFLFIQRNQIIDPITELSKEVRKFRDGQYAITIHKDSRDEVGELNKCFADMGVYIQDLIERVYKSRLSEKEAQLMYLQSQINPHFLYNTLDSIRWMAIKEKRMDIAVQIEALSNLFKHALNKGKDMTTLEEEVIHLKNYLTIQKNRFGDLIDVTIELEDTIKKHPVLNLILQPLVENSIEHGLGSKLGHGEVRVCIKQEGKMIRYVVEDNGLGTDERLVQNKLNGSGESQNALALVNINKRIKYKYGEQYGINFSSEIGVGTKVEIMIPMEELL